LLASLLLAAASIGGDLYSCISPQGERLSRDRLIEECSGVEQTVRRSDGRIERIPPAPSADEIARREAEKERVELERQKKIKEDRADRLLVSRSPPRGPLTRRRARTRSPAPTARSVSRRRGSFALEGERKKLGDEAEFYPGGRPLPTKLKSDIDRNDAALKAQRAFLQNQQGEQARVNELYDEQLTKLKKLWKR
jgi:hypothetical protein